MIVLVDNYDSFSYNLYQMVGSLYPDIKVVRNDAISVDELIGLQPEGIIISPGPGRPEDAGVCVDAIRRLDGSVPILGVCLGHQAICTAYGGTVSYAKRLMHGKTSRVDVDNSCPMFHEMERQITVGRYHSLVAVETDLPDELIVVARSADGEIMAVRHRDKPVYGLQFHPESILTPDGHMVLRNFVERGMRT